MATLDETVDELEEEMVVDTDEDLDAVWETLDSISHPDLDGIVLGYGEPPIPTKSKRERKVTLAWEEYLSFLHDRPGVWVYVFAFATEDAKSKAQARARSIRSRLRKSQPYDVWEVKVAQDRDEDGGLIDSYKVYAQYVRPATATEIKAREAEHEAAKLRGKHAAEVRLAKRNG